MNIELKDMSAKILLIVEKLKRYAALIFIVVLFGVYSFLVFRINTLNSQGPNDDDVTAKLQTVRRPKIDQSIVDKIQQLQDNSSEVKALFDKARNNPFQE